MNLQTGLALLVSAAAGFNEVGLSSLELLRVLCDVGHLLPVGLSALFILV